MEKSDRKNNKRGRKGGQKDDKARRDLMNEEDKAI